MHLHLITSHTCYLNRRYDCCTREGVTANVTQAHLRKSPGAAAGNCLQLSGLGITAYRIQVQLLQVLLYLCSYQIDMSVNE